MDEYNLLAFFMRAQFRPLLAFKVPIDEGHETDQQIETHQERISKAKQEQIDSVKRTTKHEDEERNKRQHCSRNADDIPLGRSLQRIFTTLLSVKIPYKHSCTVHLGQLARRVYVKVQNETRKNGVGRRCHQRCIHDSCY